MTVEKPHRVLGTPYAQLRRVGNHRTEKLGSENSLVFSVEIGLMQRVLRVCFVRKGGHEPRSVV